MSSYNPALPRPISHRPNLLPWLIIAALLIVVGLSVSHGFERHGQYAIAVRNCISNGGTIQRWHNPETGRIARICQLEETVFGIQIIEKIDGKWQEITAFVKRKMTRLCQVEKYMQNTGYQLLPK